MRYFDVFIIFLSVAFFVFEPIQILAKQFFTFVALLISGITFSQDYIMGTDTGTITTCSGTFYDSGGAGSLYGPNEDYTITFCPDLATNPGSVIRVEFVTFDTEGPTTACVDILTAHHGNSVATAIDNQGYCDTLTPFTIQCFYKN